MAEAGFNPASAITLLFYCGVCSMQECQPEE